MLYAEWEYIDRAGTPVTFDWIKRGSSLKKEEALYLSCFTELYKDFSADELGVEDKEAFLTKAFANVKKDFAEFRCVLLSVKKDGRVIGFIGFKPTENEKEIFITQMVLDTDYWDRGIERQMCLSICKLHDDTKRIVCVFRRINSVYKEWFTNMGFTECDYMHPGYDPQYYVGYEYWVR